MGGQRNLIILIVALAMGAFAVYIANAFFSSVEKRNQQIAQELKLGTVVVARVQMKYGDQLTPEKLRIVQWPSSSVPPGAVSDIRILTASPQGVRVALRPIEPGEPVLQSMLTGPGGRAVISATLPKDKRAVALRVNDVAGVAGFVLPGDSVDVLLTRQPATGGNMQVEQITDTIVENVRVIAADQNSNDNSKDPQLSKTVTLEVDPVQAKKIALAGQIGTLSLSLRNAADQQKAADPRTISVADLGSGGFPYYSMPRAMPAAMPIAYRPSFRPHEPQGPRPDTRSVIVGKGVKISTVEVKP